MNNKQSVVFLLFVVLIGVVHSSYLDQLLGMEDESKDHGRMLGRRNKCTPEDGECARYGGRCMTAHKCRKKLGARGIFKPELCYWRHPLIALTEIEDPRHECGCCIKKETPDLTGAKDMHEEIAGAASLEDYTGHEGDRITFHFVNTDPVLDTAKPLGGKSSVIMKARKFNMLLTVDSKLISNLYDEDKLSDHEELVGFNTYSNAENNVYCNSNGKDFQCHGLIEGHVHSESIDAIFGYEDITPDKGDKVFTSQFVHAVVEVSFNVDEETLADSSALEAHEGTVDFDKIIIHVQPSMKQQKMGLKEWSLSVVDGAANRGASKYSLLSAGIQSVITVYEPEQLFPGTILQLWEAKQRLCVQPVRIRNRSCKYKIFGFCFFPTYTYSGSGLAFGQPGADDEWGKVDITFDWQPWITVIDNSNTYQSLTTSEMSSLLAEVSEPNCVEVFFAPKFSPSDTYGGGACWSSGTANAKIISSDEQVASGIDVTHLAHELGHALGLMHPGTGSATYPDGSTGTLMCPSGWLRDNPDRNSRDNGNNVVNPLLVSYYSFLTIDTHDCNSSADCGTCSAHMR